MSLQALVLDNIEVLGYSHQNNFWGEKSFAYSATKTLSIRGFVLDLQNAVGVQDVFNDTTTIRKVSKDFQNIIIKGVNYGVGKFVSLSFDEGNWVKSTKFNADIQIFSEVPLQSLGSNFSNIDLSKKRLELLKSFSETFDINFDQNSKVLGGTHTINIEYDANNKDINVISFAQSLATELLNNTVPTNLSEANYSTRAKDSYTVLNNESYDIINGKCGFTRTFSYTTNNLSKPYSINRSLSIDVNIDGIASVKENCIIKAESANPSLYGNALIGLNEQIGDSYNRCNTFFTVYQSKLNITNPLKNIILDKNIKINKFNGTIEYDLSFDNNNKNNSTYTWEYISTLDRDSAYIWTASEQGTIVGIGDKKNNSDNITFKYANAQTKWNTEKNNIGARLQSFWTAQADIRGTSFNIVTKQDSRSPYQGQITYNYSYTDDPTIRVDLGDIKKLDIEYTDDADAGNKLPIIYKEYIIPNNGYPVVQQRGLTQQGTFSITVKAEIALTSQTAVFNGLSYFETLKTQARSVYAGGTQDKYLESVSFSSDEIEQNATYEEVYKYS
jgi:hypothetical protein